MTDAVTQTSRLLIFALCALSLSGCQTMRGMLKPYVCDCTADARAEDCPADTAPGYPREDAPRGALAASHDAATTSVERATAEARLETESDEPSYRTIERAAAKKEDEERAPKEPAKDPLELLDPVVAEAGVDLSDASRTDSLQDAFGVTMPEGEGALVMTGNFSKEPGAELLIIEPNNRLSFYSSDQRIARFVIDGDRLDSRELGELGIAEDQAAARAVRLVDDGTIQVLMHWREQNDNGGVAYKVGIFKVIGPFVGRIFARTLATSETEDSELVRRGTYEVLRGDAHRFIRWIPADDAGELLTDQAEMLKWNRWEGVFRVPKPAPTAPTKDDLRSERAAPLPPTSLAQR